jgi:hypothetical protein
MRKLLGVVLIIAALAPMLGKVPLPKPDTVPSTPAVEVPQTVKDALAGFGLKKQEAATWSGLLVGLARTIEADGKHPEGPRLKTMLDIDELRKWVVACPPLPIDGGQLIGGALGPELAKLGISNESLEEQGRRAAIVKLLDGAASHLEVLAK